MRIPLNEELSLLTRPTVKTPPKQGGVLLTYPVYQSSDKSTKRTL